MESLSKIAATNGLQTNSQSLQKQASPSRIEGLKLALGKFALLRGEVLDALRLESYSKALAEFPDDADTLAVLDRLVRATREAYEAKIPELGNLLGMVRERRGERLRAAEQAKRDAEHAAYLKDVKEHPENYFTMQELHEEYQSRRTQETA